MAGAARPVQRFRHDAFTIQFYGAQPQVQVPGEVGDPWIGELFDEDLIARLRQRHEREKNRVLSSAGHDDAIDRRIEARPANPRRSSRPVVPGARMMLIAEYPSARRSRHCRRETVGQLFHIRKGHEGVDREVEHALLGPLDLDGTRADECAAPDLAAQQPAALGFDVRPCHRRERHTELVCEDALRRQAGAGPEPARFDLAADCVSDGLIDRAASLPSGRQLYCHACNVSLDCLQCQDKIHSIVPAWRQCPFPRQRTSSGSAPSS